MVIVIEHLCSAVLEEMRL